MEPKDDIAVRREAISALFNPPPRKTAFHDMVNKGKIVMAGDLRGCSLGAICNFVLKARRNKA